MNGRERKTRAGVTYEFWMRKRGYPATQVFARRPRSSQTLGGSAGNVTNARRSFI